MEKKQTHIQYGLFTGLAISVLGLVLYLAGVAFKPGVSYIIFIPFLAGIILNSMAFSKANDGYVTFGSVFGSNFRATMIIVLIAIAWSLICMFVFPGMKEQALEVAHAEMAKNPKMTDETIDTAMNITKKYWNVIIIAGSLFGNMFYGAIFSLIGAAVAKKNKPVPGAGSI